MTDLNFKHPKLVKREWEDIFFTGVMTPGTNEAYVEFALYGMEAIGETPQYLGKASQHSMDTTIDLSEVNPIVHGSIKFDGCMNFDFINEPGYCQHFCSGRKKFKELAEAMGRVYDMAAEMMPDNKEYL